MALIVETGAGVQGAEAYASVAFVDAFWAARGGSVPWAGATEGEKEAALRLVTDWLDIHYLSGNEPYVYGQGLAFPFEFDENPLTKVPALQKASALLAPLALDGPLVGIQADEPQVVQRTEKIGDLSESTTYANQGGGTLTINGTDVSYVDRLLSGLSFGGGVVVGRRSW